MSGPWFPITIFPTGKGLWKSEDENIKCAIFHFSNYEKQREKKFLFKCHKVGSILFMRLNSATILLQYIISYILHPLRVLAMSKIKTAFIMRVNIIFQHHFLCFFVLNYGTFVHVIFYSFQRTFYHSVTKYCKGNSGLHSQWVCVLFLFMFSFLENKSRVLCFDVIFLICY